MTLDDLRLITPLVIVAGTILVLMIAASIRRSHRAAIALTLAGLALAFAALFRPAIGPVGALLVVDDYTRVYAGPGPVRDTKEAGKAIDLIHHDLAKVCAEMRSRGLPVDAAPPVQTILNRAKDPDWKEQP